MYLSIEVFFLPIPRDTSNLKDDYVQHWLLEQLQNAEIEIYGLFFYLNELTSVVFFNSYAVYDTPCTLSSLKRDSPAERRFRLDP